MQLRLCLLCSFLLGMVVLCAIANQKETSPNKVIVGRAIFFTSSEGRLERREVEGRVGWTAVGAARFLYGDIIQPKSSHVRIEIDVHDGGYRGKVYARYDSTDETVRAEERYPGAWKGSEFMLDGKNAWATVTLKWSDARLARRCNGHDFRIELPHTHEVVIADVRVQEMEPVPLPVRCGCRYRRRGLRGQ